MKFSVIIFYCLCALCNTTKPIKYQNIEKKNVDEIWWSESLKFCKLIK